MAPLIVGGGPAGAAAGIVLARAGVRATILERTRGTADPLCGGFLSWRTIATLEALGVSADALTRERVTRLRLFARDRMVEAPLPRPALAVSRRRLDAVLLARAADTGAAIERGVAARAWEDGALRTDDGARLRASALLLATGKHDVRGLARPAGARGHDPSIGLRVRLHPSAALRRRLAGTIELHLFDRGYAGLVVQEDGSANLACAVRRSRLGEQGKDPAALLRALAADAPPLAERLADMAGPVEAVANVPYGWQTGSTGAAIYRLGDQAAVIPSLAGEGIGIALASGASAARAIAAGEAAPAWQRRFADSARRPLRVAGTARALAERPGLAALLAPLLGPATLRVLAAATRIGEPC